MKKTINTTFTFGLFSLRMIRNLGEKKDFIEMGTFSGKKAIILVNPYFIKLKEAISILFIIKL